MCIPCNRKWGLFHSLPQLKTLRLRILRYFIISVFPKMMCVCCSYPTVTIPQAVPGFCKIDILGTLSAISNETTDSSLELTQILGNPGLLLARREGWICACACRSPAPAEEISFAKESLVLEAGLCLGTMCPKLLLTSVNSSAFIISFRPAEPLRHIIFHFSYQNMS